MATVEAEGLEKRFGATRALCDGVSEEILYAISRMPGLKVIGSTSSFAFRGRDKARAGKALNATHVLDGSEVDNDRTIDAYGRVAISHARAGADLIVTYWARQFARSM